MAVTEPGGRADIRKRGSAKSSADAGEQAGRQKLAGRLSEERQAQMSNVALWSNRGVI